METALFESSVFACSLALWMLIPKDSSNFGSRRLSLSLMTYSQESMEFKSTLCHQVGLKPTTYTIVVYLSWLSFKLEAKKACLSFKPYCSIICNRECVRDGRTDRKRDRQREGVWEDWQRSVCFYCRGWHVCVCPRFVYLNLSHSISRSLLRR